MGRSFQLEGQSAFPQGDVQWELDSPGGWSHEEPPQEEWSLSFGHKGEAEPVLGATQQKAPGLKGELPFSSQPGACEALDRVLGAQEWRVPRLGSKGLSEPQASPLPQGENAQTRLHRNQELQEEGSRQRPSQEKKAKGPSSHGKTEGPWQTGISRPQKGEPPAEDQRKKREGEPKPEEKQGQEPIKTHTPLEEEAEPPESGR